MLLTALHLLVWEGATPMRRKEQIPWYQFFFLSRGNGAYIIFPGRSRGIAAAPGAHTLRSQVWEAALLAVSFLPL